MPALTDISYIKMLCEKYGFSLAKRFGQHFLINPGICPKICDVAGITKTSNVLEIGPGFGTLTKELAARARKVISLEVDERLLPVLDETLAGVDNVKISHTDVMQCDIAALISSSFDGPVTVCGNLPYNITSPIIMKLLETQAPITNITAMVQKEAAQRITALTGSREAGAISYAVHYYAQPKLAFTVKAGSFFPPPKVLSAVIDLKIKQMPLLQQQPERKQRMFRMVRLAFEQRRKTLPNAVAAGLTVPKEQIIKALQQLGLPEKARPEQLTLESFVALEQLLWP